MTIAIKNLADVIEQSLALDAPAFDDVADELDRLESELMKKGTLAYFEIDWEETYGHSLQALKAGAHIDAVAAASTALLQEGDIEDLPEFAGLLSTLLQENWQALHPQNAKFDRLKKMRMQELLDAIPRRLEKEPIQVEGFEAVINGLIKAASDRGLDPKALQGISIARPSSSAPSDGGFATPQAAQIGGSEPAPSGGYSADLDAKGRSQLKRDVVALAERIEAFRSNDPTPYYLRAFAATIELKTAPEGDADGVSAMNAMPSEIADPFERALTTPSLATLKQLEQRLLNSPDWFEGQAFAALLAQALSMPMVEEAIRNRVQSRLTQLPEFYNLKYSNGEAFLPKKARDVLLPQKTSQGQAQNDMREEDDDDLLGLLESALAEQGLAEALDLVEQEYHKSQTERERAKITLDRAEFLINNGLKTLASASLLPLEERFAEAALKEWDAALYRRFQILKDNLGQG